jgi:hypothetical protein
VGRSLDSGSRFANALDASNPAQRLHAVGDQPVQRAGMLTPPDSDLWKTVGFDSGDTSGTKIATEIGGAAAYGMKHPYSLVTDPFMIDRIKKAQQAFLDQHGGTLDLMSDNLRDARQALQSITNLVGQTDFGSQKLKQIMDDKERCGDAAYNKILDALGQTTDPDERAQLEKMRDDMKDWMQTRDQRLSNEKPVVDDLSKRMDSTEKALLAQRGPLADSDAAFVSGPSNLTADGRVVDSTHIEPQAAQFARSLRQLFAGSKANLDGALSGR